MKPELQVKFLQFLNEKKQGEEGFTLIELLVVIIIIGILAAIALPSLLGQANKAKQSEARNNIGAINRGQQAYFLENQNFTTDIPSLGLGLKTQTVNYQYSIRPVPPTPAGTTNVVYNWARPIKTALKAYVGITGTSFSDASQTEATTTGNVCETKVAWDGSTNFTLAAPTAINQTSCSDLPTFQNKAWKDLGA